MIRHRGWLALTLTGLLAAAPAVACPFCGMQGQTLAKEADQAAFVVYGLLAKPNLIIRPDGTEEGTTELTIDDKGVIKDHEFLKGKKQLTLPRYIPVDDNNKVKFVVFCDLFEGRIDPYRGIPVKEVEFVEYLKGALAVKDKDVPARLRFFFKYLGSHDSEIATDAFKEFGNTDGKEVLRFVADVRKNEKERRAMAKQLAEWLSNPETPAYRFGLFGYLLGLVGVEQDAAVLHDVLTDEKRGLISGVDGVLAGYILLKPNEGFRFLRDVLANEDGKNDFIRRYAAVRTLRYFWTDSPETIQRKELVAAMRLLLPQSDIADFAIDDLRKWKQWQLVDEILALNDKESHDVPVVKRAILKFAVSCARSEAPAEFKNKAKAFVDRMRERDPKRVEGVEELLKLEGG